MKLTNAQNSAVALAGKHKNTLLFGGSRSGKTFVLCYLIVVRALAAPKSRHAIFRSHYNTVKKSIGKDTMPKLLRLLGIKYTFLSNEVFYLPNGSEIWLLGLDDKERVDKILGMEFASVYFNECSEISYDAVQTALTRLAQKCTTIYGDTLNLKAFYDCNPSGKTHWSYKVFIRKISPDDNKELHNPAEYGCMKINPADNINNLNPEYLKNLQNLSDRKRRRFLDGNFADDLEGALWTDTLINQYRVTSVPCELLRIVVAIDPAVSSTAESDESGIIVVGEGTDGDYYVLHDGSMRDTPTNWCRRAIELYREYEADRIIGEVNNGGDLIETLLRSIDRDIPFRAVRASKGKIKRAEPIAALYEQGRVHHVGSFDKLEEQMTSYVPSMVTTSPDRMDALVWGLSELSSRSSTLILA